MSLCYLVFEREQCPSVWLNDVFNTFMGFTIHEEVISKAKTNVQHLGTDVEANDREMKRSAHLSISHEPNYP